MSEKISGPYTLGELSNMKGQTDWALLQREEGEGSYRGEDDEGSSADIEWGDAKLVLPEAKTPVSLRIDPDVLDFFRSEGRGYQTRMNAVLRAYMNAKKAGRA